MKTLKSILVAVALILIACTPKVAEKATLITPPSPTPSNVKTETKFPDGWLAYTLKTLDAENGLYVVDEENSIKLESYLFENKLVSWYVVQGSLILASFEKRDSQIVFEILAGKEEAVSVTGGEEVDGEPIPEVKTMPFTVMQRAFLSRE